MTRDNDTMPTGGVTQADGLTISDLAMSLMWLMEDESCLDSEDPCLKPYCNDEEETDPINECYEAGLLIQTGYEDLFLTRITEKGRAFIARHRTQSTQPYIDALKDARVCIDQLERVARVHSETANARTLLATINELIGEE